MILAMTFNIDVDDVKGMSADDILNKAYGYCYINGLSIPQSGVYFEEELWD